MRYLYCVEPNLELNREDSFEIFVPDRAIKTFAGNAHLLG